VLRRIPQLHQGSCPDAASQGEAQQLPLRRLHRSEGLNFEEPLSSQGPFPFPLAERPSPCCTSTKAMLLSSRGQWKPRDTSRCSEGTPVLRRPT